MCGPSLSSSPRSPNASRCGSAESTANAARLIALLFVMTPGAVVTDGWSYRYGGETFTEPGEWVHLPAGEAGNLLLWIKGVEAGS